MAYLWRPGGCGVDREHEHGARRQQEAVSDERRDHSDVTANEPHLWAHGPGGGVACHGEKHLYFWLRFAWKSIMLFHFIAVMLSNLKIWWRMDYLLFSFRKTIFDCVLLFSCCNILLQWLSSHYLSIYTKAFISLHACLYYTYSPVFTSVVMPCCCLFLFLSHKVQLYKVCVGFIFISSAQYYHI